MRERAGDGQRERARARAGKREKERGVVQSTLGDCKPQILLQELHIPRRNLKPSAFLEPLNL